MKEKLNIINGFHFARKVVATNECDFLVLDEILALPDYQIATADMIKEILKLKDSSMHIIMTGKRLPEELKEYVDCVKVLDSEYLR